MIRKTTALLGAGILAAGLAAPLAASAHADDSALAFVIGAAVGQALDHDQVRYVHRRHGYHGRKFDHRPHGKAHGWYKWNRKWHHGADRRYHRERHHDRYERRHDRHDRRHERRHDRRDDRRERRHHG